MEAQEVSKALQGTLASLKENMAVLDILDGSAESWPGVSACLEAMSAATSTAADMLVETSRDCSNAELQLHQTRDKLDATQKQLSDAQADAQSSASSLAAKQGDVDRLQRQLKAAKAEASKAQSDAQAQATAWEKQCSELRQQLADLAKDHRRQQEDMEFQDAEMASVKEAVASQVDELVELREDLAGRKAEVVHLQGENAKLAEQLQTGRNELTGRQAQLHQADLRGSQLTAEVGQLRRDLSKEQRDHADTQTKLAGTHEELDKAKHWNDIQVTVNMDKLQEQKSNFVAYQQETASAIADREKAIERLKAELRALGDRLEHKTQDLVSIKRNVTVLEMQLRDTNTEVQAKEIEAAKALDQKQVACDCAIADSKAAAAVRSALAAGWERDAHMLQQKVDSLEASNKSMLDATLDLKEKSSEAAGKEMVLKAEHTMRVAQLEQQLARCQEELEDARVAKALMQAELKGSITNMTTTVKATQQHLQNWKPQPGAATQHSAHAPTSQVRPLLHSHPQHQSKVGAATQVSNPAAVEPQRSRHAQLPALPVPRKSHEGLAKEASQRTKPPQETVACVRELLHRIELPDIPYNPLSPSPVRACGVQAPSPGPPGALPAPAAAKQGASKGWQSPTKQGGGVSPSKASLTRASIQAQRPDVQQPTRASIQAHRPDVQQHVDAG